MRSEDVPTTETATNRLSGGGSYRQRGAEPQERSMTNVRETYLRSYIVIRWESGEYQWWENWAFSAVEWKRNK